MADYTPGRDAVLASMAAPDGSLSNVKMTDLSLQDVITADVLDSDTYTDRGGMLSKQYTRYHVKVVIRVPKRVDEQVLRGGNDLRTDATYVIKKRYRDFQAFHDEIAAFVRASVQFPVKKANFIEKKDVEKRRIRLNQVHGTQTPPLPRARNGY